MASPPVSFPPMTRETPPPVVASASQPSPMGPPPPQPPAATSPLSATTPTSASGGSTATATAPAPAGKASRTKPKKAKKNSQSDIATFGRDASGGSSGKLPAFFEDAPPIPGDMGELEGALEGQHSDSAGASDAAHNEYGSMTTPLSDGARGGGRMGFDLQEATSFLKNRWNEAASYNGVETIQTTAAKAAPKINLQKELQRCLAKKNGETLSSSASDEPS